MDLKELESGVDPKKHWYYQSKKIPLIDFVKKKFLALQKPLMLVDVGSGSGFFMFELYEKVPEMISKIYLVDIGYSEEEIAATKNQPVEKTKSLPIVIENAVIVMMDVLEHLENDHAMLKAIRNNCRGENYFFITVPAFTNLWSGHDVYLGHYRRYTLATLRDLLHRSGFTQFSSYYIYGAIFPLVWMKRKFQKQGSLSSDMKPSSSIVNKILLTSCSAEMKLRYVNQLAGVSCVAEGKI